nr:hypothetical protein CFP56_01113 [Quercus suber]
MAHTVPTSNANRTVERHSSRIAANGLVGTEMKRARREGNQEESAWIGRRNGERDQTSTSSPNSGVVGVSSWDGRSHVKRLLLLELRSCGGPTEAPITRHDKVRNVTLLNESD